MGGGEKGKKSQRKLRIIEVIPDGSWPVQATMSVLESLPSGNETRLSIKFSFIL